MDFGIPLITNLQLARQFVEAMTRKPLVELENKSWDEPILNPCTAAFKIGSDSISKLFDVSWIFFNTFALINRKPH